MYRLLCRREKGTHRRLEMSNVHIDITRYSRTRERNYGPAYRRFQTIPEEAAPAADALVATEVAQNDRDTPAEPLRREDAGDVRNGCATPAKPYDHDLVSTCASNTSEYVARMHSPVPSASDGFQLEAVPAWKTIAGRSA